MEQKKRNSVGYFVRKFIQKKSGEKEYLSLDTLEELLKDLNDCLVMMCELLHKANMTMEAKGVFIRHKLKVGDFMSLVSPDCAKIGKEIEALKYDKTKDW